MKRREFMQKLWSEARGIAPRGARVTIAGGGIAGLTLALSLQRRGVAVTLYEPRRRGGVRVPLFHACRAGATEAPLWQTAAAISREWYAPLVAKNAGVERNSENGNSYYILHNRRYLRYLSREFERLGGVTIAEKFDPEQQIFPRPLLWISTAGVDSLQHGRETLNHACQAIHGSQSYFGKKIAFGEGASAEDGDNLIGYKNRTAFIHRNSDTRDAALAKVRALQFTGRHALFAAKRLTTRDRQPIVGFAPPQEIETYDRLYYLYNTKNSTQMALSASRPFFFTGFGYHACTYVPYLAESVAAQLTATDEGSENMVSPLSPVRFLPRGHR